MNTYWTEAAQLYLILHQSCFSLKSDHQDLLRSFTFTVPQRRNDLHLTSSEETLLFISQSALHCIICLDHFSLILLRHIIGDIERPLIFRSFYASICWTVRNISLMYITSIRISSLFVHLNISICSKLHIFAQSLNKIELFCLHILTVLDYMSYKSLYQNMKHICKLFVLDLTKVTVNGSISKNDLFFHVRLYRVTNIPCVFCVFSRGCRASGSDALWFAGSWDAHATDPQTQQTGQSGTTLQTVEMEKEEERQVQADVCRYETRTTIQMQMHCFHF